MHRRRFDISASRWLAVATAVVPLALMGCGSGQRTGQGTPTERVAGERQEDETPRLVREAGLPETFSFGGRTWRAHQIHWEEISDVSATATTGTKIGDYAPVADLMVNGQQIFRQEGADEAMTDNIFLMTENMPAAAAGTDQATTEAGMRRVAFVEYDASGETMATTDLNPTLSTAGLPKTITHAGKKWTAEEVQLYDADVFDEVAAMPEMINGHKAYREQDDDDTLFVMAEAPMTAPGSTGAPGAPSNEPGVSPGEMTDTATRGSIFIRYELNK
ncbi:MAG: hypothetical protein ACO1SX_21785 [Actinomycetota bacterium]